MRGFFFKLNHVKWGKSIFNLDLLNWEDTPLIQIFLRWEYTLLIWGTPSAGSLHKEHGRRKLAFLPACSPLTGKSIPLPALEPTSLKF